MSQALALEAQTIVRRAAQPVAPGETIKAQMRRAWSVLGHPPMWRLRAAWYGEAGTWSASAFEDFRIRYRLWREKQEREASAKTNIDLEFLRSIRSQLAASDPNIHREAIAALDEALRDCGRSAGEVGASDSPGDF